MHRATRGEWCGVDRRRRPRPVGTDKGENDEASRTYHSCRPGFGHLAHGVQQFIQKRQPTGEYCEFDNLAGGINGRTIDLIVADAESSPTGFLTVAQGSRQQGRFRHHPRLVVHLRGYRYLQQHGIPVAGNAQDGPEWGQQPNTNMFSFFGDFDSKEPANTLDGVFFKSLGVTNGWPASPTAYRPPLPTASRI